MERPFVVCHMLASLDGKIDGEFFGLPQAAQAIKTYGELRSFYGCQATLYGTTTMLGGYSDGKAGKLPPAESNPPRADWVNPAGKTMGNFIVAVDPKGELAYSAPTIEKKGRPAAHVIEVLTQQASSDYLAYLQGLGVSYLFAGKDRLDCTLLLRKLYCLFAIDTFVQDRGWYAAQSRYAVFLQRHKQGKVLYLELGVGNNTPGIIKYPFWRYTLENPDAAYACVNLGQANVPREIADRSVFLNMDIGQALTAIHRVNQ